MQNKFIITQYILSGKRFTTAHEKQQFLFFPTLGINYVMNKK